MATISLERFSLRDMAECGKALRELGERSTSLEQFAERTVRYFYETLVSPGGDNACALVRFFSTQPADLLSAELRATLPDDLPGSVRCLTLLGTMGEKEAWRERTHSQDHRAIPLINAEKVQKLPMIYQLIRQLGLDLGDVLNPRESVIIDENEKTYNVFYVANAKGSPVIPHQTDFVEPYGLKSVLGFGGMLPSGDLFAVILFAKVFLTRSAADLFRTVALSLRLAALPFDRHSVPEAEKVTCV